MVRHEMITGAQLVEVFRQPRRPVGQLEEHAFVPALARGTRRVMVDDDDPVRFQATGGHRAQKLTDSALARGTSADHDETRHSMRA
jgi:hypothetical protein